MKTSTVVLKLPCLIFDFFVGGKTTLLELLIVEKNGALMGHLR